MDKSNYLSKNYLRKTEDRNLNLMVTEWEHEISAAPPEFSAHSEGIQVKVESK